MRKLTWAYGAPNSHFTESDRTLILGFSELCFYLTYYGMLYCSKFSPVILSPIKIVKHIIHDHIYMLHIDQWIQCWSMTENSTKKLDCTVKLANEGSGVAITKVHGSCCGLLALITRTITRCSKTRGIRYFEIGWKFKRVIAKIRGYRWSQIDFSRSTASQIAPHQVQLLSVMTSVYSRALICWNNPVIP